MHPIRQLVHARPQLAMALLALLLCFKAVVPPGYMIGGGFRTLTIELCSQRANAPKSVTVTIPVEQDRHERTSPVGDAATCAFSALTMAALGAIDGEALPATIAIRVALNFFPSVRWPGTASDRLRPPTRAPPLLS